MNKLIYDLTIKNWFLKDIETNYSDKENCYAFHHKDLKGFNLDILVDKETGKPTRCELWVSRFNHVGIRNNLDEIYTLADYKQLIDQLSIIIKVFENMLEEIKLIVAPYNISIIENKLTYDGATGLDLRDILGE